MGTLIEKESESEEFISIGNTKTQLSIKDYQNIYNQVTGRTEKIKQRYSENIKIEYSDLEQLHYKITQLCDIHRIVAKNEVITVYYNKERNESFTSFERFKFYNRNCANPTASVIIKYNFSLIPAGIQTTQEYTVTIKLQSRVTTLKLAAEEAPPFLKGNIISFMSENTAEISVEYVDYIVARGFIEAFNEWIACCPKQKNSKLLKFARAWSHLCSGIIKFIINGLIVYFFYTDAYKFINGSDLPGAAKYFIAFLGAIILVQPLADTAGGAIESAIDSYPILSYLKLNKGDENIIDNFRDSKTLSLVKFIFGAILSIGLGVISSKIEKLL